MILSLITLLAAGGAFPQEPPVFIEPKRLDFRRGEPSLSIRLMEGRQQISFSARGRMRIQVAGTTGADSAAEADAADAVEKTVEAPAGSRWTVRIVRSTPAHVRTHLQLAELHFRDKAGLLAERHRWAEREVPLRVHTLGSVYGISGKVIDNRRYLVLLDQLLSPTQIADRRAELWRRFGVRAQPFEELQREAHATLELLDEGQARVAVGSDRITCETLDGSPIDVSAVEYGVGYHFHGFEDRSFRGSLELAVDRHGTLAAINRLPLEELLKGLVPAEMFARAPAQALKAQAVTARGEVLAKVGLKHLADPYLLCAEQHCAVYRGLTGEALSTTAAVVETRGEALFSTEGRLVDSVYSAVCGGHTEHNEAVWSGPANPSLRGKPDSLAPPSEGGQGAASVAPSIDGRSIGPQNLPAYLAAPLPAACRLASLGNPSKFRWNQHFTAQEVNAFTAELGVGEVEALTVLERGVSGRARLLSVTGKQGSSQVKGELNIRRLFGMLNSAMFVVTPERGPEGSLSGWLFQGGGWGHGAGMCQWGAMGRAEAGHDYQKILRHYFNGAQVVRIYP